MTTDQIAAMQATLQGHREVLIFPHNDPDPDAIASAVALRYLLVHKFDLEARILYGGIVGRAENKALVNYLGKPLHRFTPADLKSGKPIALVDTQPGAGNHPIPVDVTPTIVIDHHTWLESSGAAKVVDVRPAFGATSTILTQYFQAAEVELPSPIATALFYGIKTDTLGLSRAASEADAAAYFALLPQIDVDALISIERAQVPLEYFKAIDAALHNARVYDRDVVIAFIGEMGYPDLGAEMADLLMRLEKVQWVVCMGVINHELILSVRTRKLGGGAGKLVRAIVGGRGAAGGHGTMAAGHIILLPDEHPGELANRLTSNILKQLKGSDQTPSVNIL